MLKSFVLACTIVVGAAGTALAQSDCAEPLAPASIDGSKANLKQIADASHDANVFMKQSGDYQDCLRREVSQQKAEAERKKKPFDPSIADAANARIDENQKMKEKVGLEFQTALATFCRANPTADPSCQKILAH
jgi:hypothetical protein